MRHFTSSYTEQCRNSSSNLLTPYREQPQSTRILKKNLNASIGLIVPCGLPTANVLSNKMDKSRSYQFFINKPKFLKAARYVESRKIEMPRSMMLEALSCEAGARVSILPSKPCASLKNAPRILPVRRALLACRKKTNRGQRSAFPSETSRFTPLILAHKCSVLP